MTEVQHGDTWETRDGRAVVVASNRWPPPAPGSHESDLYVADVIAVQHKADVLIAWPRWEIDEWYGGIRYSRTKGTTA